MAEDYQQNGRGENLLIHLAAPFVWFLRAVGLMDEPTGEQVIRPPKVDPLESHQPNVPHGGCPLDFKEGAPSVSEQLLEIEKKGCPDAGKDFSSAHGGEALKTAESDIPAAPASVVKPPEP